MFISLADLTRTLKIPGMFYLPNYISRRNACTCTQKTYSRIVPAVSFSRAQLETKLVSINSKMGNQL
jgi:hypothetical protein